MKIRRAKLIYWLRLTRNVDLWWNNGNYRGFVHLPFISLNWYPAVNETEHNIHRYWRYMHLAGVLAGKGGNPYETS